MKCSKCGSSENSIKHILKGKTIDTSFAKGKGTPDKEFLEYREYDFFYTVISRHEHLRCVCKNCGFRWREHTEDNLMKLKKSTNEI